MRFLLSVEKLAPDETPLVVSDRDPDALVRELKPVLERGLQLLDTGGRSGDLVHSYLPLGCGRERDD